MTKKTINTVIIDGKEFNIDEKLPDTYLKKDYQGIPYIDISLVRDILRQIGVLKKISFGPIQKVAEGQTSITYTQKAIIELNDGTILEGDGYMNISNKKILSGAAFGVLSNLKSRAVKTALTYYKKIFELPVEGEEELNEQVAKEAEKKGDEPKKVENNVDIIEKYVEFIGQKNPQNLEEYKKYKSEFNKKYLNQIKALPKTELEKLKQISKEYEDNFKS